jgi:hypothetical protein
MSSLLKSFLLTLLLCLALIKVSQAQTYGQIFTKQEADDLYGPVLFSVSVSKLSVHSFLTQTNDYIMFNIRDNKLIVLDRHRKPIFPKKVLTNSSEVFHMYSVSVLNELLSLDNDNTVYVEQRTKVLSVSSGGYTMEVGVWCPPMCD